MFSKLNETTMLLHYLAGCKTTKIIQTHQNRITKTVIKKNLNGGCWETKYIRKAKVKIITYCSSEIIQAKM